MNLKRLLSYGLAGILAGLLLENEILRKRQKSNREAAKMEQPDKPDRGGVKNDRSKA